MNEQQTKIKYFLYARKSSEGEDRQVQSIDDQVNRLKELAADTNIKIVQLLTESKSAQKPNNRPIFDSMMERIESGEADGILCWQINRLSRNPIDSGKISWLLQRGIIKSIQTIDREYRPEDNVLLFNLESGSANQYLLDLSKNVRRGLSSKLDKGWFPSIAPVGYLNDVINHTIVKDPERFNIVQKAWGLMLTGNYTVPQIWNKTVNEWGLTSVKRRKVGGEPLRLNALYKIFSNLFYTGQFLVKGQIYQGKHDPLITLDEFDHVQILLGRKGRPRPKTHVFPFTGIMRCGDCGCLITAETKTKLIKTENKLKSYTYYHCTHKKTDKPCFQKKVIPEAELESQIEKEIMGLTILPEFKQWALEALNNKNDREIDERSKIYEAQHKALTEAQADLDKLSKAFYREKIDEAFYIKEKQELTSKIETLKTQMRETEGRAERWLELSEKVFNFSLYAYKAFLNGNLETRREILAALGSNYIIKDQKLTITYNKYFEPIIKHYPALEANYRRLELDESLTTKEKTAVLTAVISQWRTERDSNPRPLP